MEYTLISKALTGSNCTYSHERIRYSTATALHINRILDLSNEFADKNTLKLWQVEKGLRAIAKNHSITFDEAAKVLRNAIEKNYGNGKLKDFFRGKL
jgi:hypothetical protein